MIRAIVCLALLLSGCRDESSSGAAAVLSAPDPKLAAAVQAEVQALAGEEQKAKAFFLAESHPGDKLDAQACWPRGRRFVYMGYSGKPEQNLAQGFSVAGPVYGDQMPYLEKCAAMNWPVVAHVGLKLNFVKGGDAAKYDAATLRQEITFQGKLQAMTAQGRLSGYIVSAMPFILAGVLTLIAPDLMHPLYSTLIGWSMIVAVIVMVTVGSFIIKKIVTIEV